MIYIQKMAIILFIIIPSMISIVRFIPEVVFSLNIETPENDIIIIILIIWLAVICNKWIFKDES